MIELSWSFIAYLTVTHLTVAAIVWWLMEQRTPPDAKVNKKLLGIMERSMTISLANSKLQNEQSQKALERAASISVGNARVSAKHSDSLAKQLNRSKTPVVVGGNGRVPHRNSSLDALSMQEPAVTTIETELEEDRIRQENEARLRLAEAEGRSLVDPTEATEPG